MEIIQWQVPDHHTLVTTDKKFTMMQNIALIKNKNKKSTKQKYLPV